MAHRKPLPREHTPDVLPDPRAFLSIEDKQRALREFAALWQQIRPPARLGRPPGSGSKFTNKAVLLSFYLDLFKLPPAKALRALELDWRSGSDGFKKLDRYWRAGRPWIERAFLEEPGLREEFVAAQQAVAKVNPMVKRWLLIQVKAIVFGRDSSEHQQTEGAPPL